jgi:DNA topoisomerase-1
VYQEASDDEEEEARGDARTLAALRAGMPLTFIEVQPRQHFTQPPPRYTEASLIKALEEKGIGRPSTYATILSTLLEREYVRREARHLVPTPLGELVRDLLTEHFPNIVDEGFTARMEEELDEIARGEKQWVPVVREFYDPFSEALRTAQRTMEKVELPEETTDERCPECGRPMVVKRSRFGRFLGCSGYPECKATRPLLARIGVACPQCGRDLIQRRSRGRGRLFYGCSGYPDCTFITNRRPLPQRCPSCGGLLVQASTRNAECLGCKKRVPLDALPDQGSPERQPVSASQPA